MEDSAEKRNSSMGGRSPVYCLVPPELATLRDVLVRDLEAEAPIEVLVDRRRRQRRSGVERRRRADHPPGGIERRLAHNIEGRRFAERRAPVIPVDPRQPLPRQALPFAGQLRFVRSDSSRREREIARLRSLAVAWRERSGEVREEAQRGQRIARREGRSALAAALAVRDRYTWEHSEAAVTLAVECAAELGLSEGEVAEIDEVALLHDIGKIGVPDAILHKAGPLSEEEWWLMRQHPVIGARLVESIDTLRHLAPAIRAEHERWDGRGYPDGLAGEEIPLASRVVFVCDAYQAMISDRPYRDPLSPDAARQELAANVGSQFWPDAASVLLEVLDRSEGD